jgi:hypothetical protein
VFGWQARSRLFRRHAPLDLHPTDIASYRDNLRQDVPRIYVVLAPADEQPPQIRLVMAAPDEAQSYLCGDPGLVDGVPMPASLIALISAYIEEHAASAATGEILEGRRFRRAHGREQPESAP